jgi:serine/threonine protein kinase
MPLNTEQVVYGLEYLHQELSLVHGSLSCNNILLNQDGTAKIGMYSAASSSLADLVSQPWRGSCEEDPIHERERTEGYSQYWKRVDRDD